MITGNPNLIISVTVQSKPIWSSGETQIPLNRRTDKTDGFLPWHSAFETLNSRTLFTPRKALRIFLKLRWFQFWGVAAENRRVYGNVPAQMHKAKLFVIHNLT